jgi:hypothetical protein
VALLGPVLAGTLLIGALDLDDRPPPGPTTIQGDGVRLTLLESGLLRDEPFSSAEPRRDFEDRFELDPLARPEEAVLRLGEDGLDVGVLEHDGFQGYFAVTNDTFPANAVFHTAMQAASGVVASSTGQGEAVFAVQTASTKVTSDVDFVLVNTVSRGGRLSWEVGQANGEYADAVETTLAEVPASPALRPVDEPVDVTLQTDGDRRMTVYLGDQQVLDAGDLDLGVAPPFQAYLEVQSRVIPYTARFTDFWVTASDVVQVEGLPPGAAVVLGPTDEPRATATADDGGVARLELALPDARGTAALALRGPDDDGWRRVPPFAYAGGDRYRVELDHGSGS